MRENDVIRAALDVSDRLPNSELTVYRENRRLVIRIDWSDDTGMRGLMRHFTKEELAYSPDYGRKYAEVSLWECIPKEWEKYHGRDQNR